MASRLKESTLPHEISQTARNRSTTSQEAAALTAATLTLMATRSSELRGRTATNAGTARSSDQKVGFENATPTGIARTTGAASTASRRRNVSASSPRTSHEIGMATTSTIPPTSAGSTIPDDRHSNQKCAEAALANALRRAGMASAI